MGPPEADPDERPRSLAAPGGRLRLLGDEALWRTLAPRLEAARLDGRPGRARLVLPGGAAFLKHSPLRGRASLRHAVRAGLLRTPAPRLREYANLAWLRREGFLAPRPLLAGALASRGLPRFQFLVTREVPAALLREALAASAADGRRAIVAALGSEVGRLHARGFLHRDLFPRNLLVLAREGGPPRVVFLDAWRGGPRPGLRGPAYDLACLTLFLPALLERDEERLLFRSYGAGRWPAGADPRALARLLRRAARERRGLLRRLAGRPSPEGTLEAPAAWTPPCS